MLGVWRKQLREMGLRGCGSKIGVQNGTLVNGKVDSNLRKPV